MRSTNLLLTGLLVAFAIWGQTAFAQTDPNFDTKSERKIEVRARHILVTTEAEADEVFERLKQGEDFVALASEVSKDANPGGELGWFQRGDIIKPVEDAVFALRKVGQISKPVQTQFGWHVLQLEGRREKPVTAAVPVPKALQVMTGTGFIVSRDGFVLTNHHVVDGCETVEIHDKGSATIKGVDEANDLAVLKIQEGTQVATFRATAPGLGESIFALGFPYSGLLGAGINFTGGLISALSGVGNDSRYLQFTAPVQPGNSGGPLIDSNGLVVGVVSGRLGDIEVLKASGSLPQNVNFAIRSDLAMGFLRANGIQPTVAEPKAALPTSDLANGARGFTVEVICEQRP